MELPPKENRKVELNITAEQLPSQAMMISAVADSCSVRLDKVNRKVYKFRALVFSPDSQGNNKEAYLSREKGSKTEGIQAPVTRGILSQQPKTEWKCAYSELLNSTKGPQKDDVSLSGPVRKRSKTAQDISSDSELLRKDGTQRVRFQETETTGIEAETGSSCPTCFQVIAKDSKNYDRLMEKSKEELVTMVINLNASLQNRNRRRKNGYSPTDKDIAQLMQLDISSSEQSTPKTRPSRTRRKPGRTNRLTSI